MSRASDDARPAVSKFGGTSLADAARYRAVLDLVDDGRPFVVVSASAGTTDALLRLCDLAEARDDQATVALDSLVATHTALIETLLDDPAEVLAALHRDREDLHDILRSTSLLRSASETTRDYVSGHGELWSARLLAAMIREAGRPATALDARDVLIVREPDGALGQSLVFDDSQARLRRFLEEHAEAQIVATGYICSTPDGTPSTLKRNGSDLSAALFAELLDARGLTIWTDVDGVLSADPRRVPEAEVTERLTYDEAIELAYFGARVLHPGTMAPCVRAGIPIVLRSALHPDRPGTRIEAAPDDDDRGPTQRAVRGFATIDEVRLVNVEGTGMMGVPGVASRVFGACFDSHVNVILISQASSEHSICIAVPEAEGERAATALRAVFDRELRLGQIQRVELSGPCSVLAAVGDRMVESPGVAGRFFRALGSAGVNVRAVAQGASERNISAVVERDQATLALRAVHAAFTLSDQTLSVGLVGPGLIGSTLLAQLEREIPRLRESRGIDLRVRALQSSRHLLCGERDLERGDWRARLDASPPGSFEALEEHLLADHLPHAVIVDCTASEEVAAQYERWLTRGIHVVTPNKKATSGPQTRFDALRARPERTHFFAEGTVGAGLPVLQTLRDLVETGDEVLRIEGILSGTLSYLFNAFDGSVPFSRLVRDAKERGFTEPDPREDLGGTDVMRKVLILAREAGFRLEPDDIPVESLIPPALLSATDVDGFLDGLADYDDEMAARLRDADEAGEVLRYTGVVDPREGCRVELRRYPKTHAFAGLGGSDNIVSFTTARYQDQPLIVRGPGAGPDVTAAGVFSDLLRLAAHLGASSSTR